MGGGGGGPPLDPLMLPQNTREYLKTRRFGIEEQAMPL